MPASAAATTTAGGGGAETSHRRRDGAAMRAKRRNIRIDVEVSCDRGRARRRRMRTRKKTQQPLSAGPADAEAPAEAILKEIEEIREVADSNSWQQTPPTPMEPVDWWDEPFLSSKKRDVNVCDLSKGEFSISRAKEWKLVQHPTQLPVVGEAADPGPQMLMLTKKERKRIRKQSRMEKLKEKHDCMRLEPPPPKMKVSTL